MTKKKKILIGLAAAAVVVLILAMLFSGGEKDLNALPPSASIHALEASFDTYLKANNYDEKLSGYEISIDVLKFNTLKTTDTGVESSDARKITWTFDVAPEYAGFYNLEVGYSVPLTETSDPHRRILLDNVVPYAGLNEVVFQNSWGKWSTVPNKAEYYNTRTDYLTADTGNGNQLPIFYLSAGTHTLSFEYIQGTMLISSLTFKAAPAQNLEPSYQAYLADTHYNGTKAEATIEVDVMAGVAADEAVIAAFPGDADLTKVDVHEGVSGLSALNTSDAGSVTWTFSVEEEGFYNLKIGYIALPGTTSDIQRQILIDGETLYNALDQIVFKRLWRDEDIRLKSGNEIRPNARELLCEQVVFMEDYDRRSGAPLVVHLTPGEHTVTFVAVKEPMAISSLTFTASPELPEYSTVSAQWKEIPAYAGEPIIGQAERRSYPDETDEKGNPKHTALEVTNATTDVLKTSPAVTVQKNYSDAALTPFHAWHILYPTIGASSWSLPGDAITWEIEVPEDGLYVLTFKGRQTSRGVTSYRRLLVNGEVPFAEADVVGFDYSGVMQNYTFADANGTPYRIPLKAGKNTITLECVLGSIGGVVSEVETSLRNLNSLYLATIQITGQVPSLYIDYEIATKVPDFVDTLNAESKRLFRLVDQMVNITGEKGENTAMLEKMAIQAEGLAKDPENIVEELSQLKNNIAALGTWINNISTMPLELDAIILSADVASLPAPREGAFQGLVAETQRFFATFFTSTSSVVSEDSGEATDKEIVVWMASAGREQAQIIQNMIDETFTPETGIRVRLQLIPMDVVLRAALAGNGPDVVIGLGQTTAQDFAMRGATVDLSQMEGYGEFVSRYSDGVLRATTYNGGAYGIPEQVSFQMFFYREDVMAELGIETVPQTWDEVMELIPVLNRENYEFYMPSARVATGLNIFMSMVYQNEGEIYQGTEGKDSTYGVASALYSDEAMEAFKWFTDLFTVHGLATSADFNNRFRTGEMPMGVTDYTTYCTLEIFAPEIKGLWSFAPLPGTLKEDGTIDNLYVCDTVQTVMMNGAVNRDHDETAWQFIQWWNSTEQQVSYATTLESVMGAAARYPAADPNVIRQLPWSNFEQKQLLAQYEHLTSMPAVPGYYMNTRMITYAFEDVVADLANPRETLYLNIRDIDKELLKKREEFGLPTTLADPSAPDATTEE